MMVPASADGAFTYGTCIPENGKMLMKKLVLKKHPHKTYMGFNNDKTYCVTLETSEKLEERGWGWKMIRIELEDQKKPYCMMAKASTHHYPYACYPTLDEMLNKFECEEYNTICYASYYGISLAVKDPGHMCEINTNVNDVCQYRPPMFKVNDPLLP